MKRIIPLFLAALCTVGASASPEPDIQDLLRGLGSKNGGSTTQQDNGNSSSKGSGVLDALTGIGNALGIIPSKTVDAKYLCGTWNYRSPAVAFKSENFLAKAGGVAASAKIESELEPYYKRFGLDKMILEVNPDSTFVMQVSRMKLSGTITSQGDKNNSRLIFNFRIMGKMSIGSMEAFVNAESSSMMSITFDVSKLLTLAKTLGSFSGGNIARLTKLLDSYDGLTAGFKMKKTSDKTSSKAQPTADKDSETSAGSFLEGLFIKKK